MPRGLMLLTLLTAWATWIPDVASGEEGLLYPLGAVQKEDGTLFILDRKLPGIWRASEGRLEVYFRASRKQRTPLNAPRCIALDHEGNVLAGDTATREIYHFDADRKPRPLTNGAIGKPMAIAVHQNGSIFVADLELHHIVKVPKAGGEPVHFADARAVRGLTFAPDGRLIAVTGIEDRQLLAFDADGKGRSLLSGRPFRFPNNVAAGMDGTLLITDGFGACVWKLATDGQPEKLVVGEPLKNPVGIVRAGNQLLITDPRALSVFRCTLDGKLTKIELSTGE